MLVVSLGIQSRYLIMAWKSLSPPRGLQLFPSCQARCPVKTSNETENYPAPSAAQLLTMLLHREHLCSYLYYIYSSAKKSTKSAFALNQDRCIACCGFTISQIPEVMTTNRFVVDVQCSYACIEFFLHKLFLYVRFDFDTFHTELTYNINKSDAFL